MLQGLSYFPVSLYIATFAKGLSNQLTATTVLSLFNVSAVIGQIIIGHLSDVMPYPSVMLFSAVGSSLGAFLLWGFANKAVYLYFFAIIFGSLVSIFFTGISKYLELTARRAEGSRRPGRTPRSSASGANRSLSVQHGPGYLSSRGSLPSLDRSSPGSFCRRAKGRRWLMASASSATGRSNFLSAPVLSRVVLGALSSPSLGSRR